MVRNAFSMEDMRNSMSDLNFSAPHPQRQYEPMPPMPEPETTPEEPPQTQESSSRVVKPFEQFETMAAYQDYRLQQELLAIRAHRAKVDMSAPSAAIDRHRHLLGEKEKANLGYGLPRSTWERDHTPSLYKPAALCTDSENEMVEKMWKVHRSFMKAERRQRELSNTNGRNRVEMERFPEPTTSTPGGDSLNDPVRFPDAIKDTAEIFCKPFCEFLTDNPTVFHAVDSTKKQLKSMGWTELHECQAWDIQRSGKYFVERNGSAMIAFVVGANYKPGNGCAILAGHVDALTAKLKPVSEVPNKAGYLQLGVAPYAGGLNSTWWDRDLGIGGRVLIKEGNKIVTKLVKLDRPIARIPTLAPHFGAAAAGPFNQETQMVPIIGLEDGESSAAGNRPSDSFSQATSLNGEHKPAGSFVSTQPPALVKAIGDELGLDASSYGKIVNWELELYDVQPATVGGLNNEFIYGGRIDDKLCSWSAMEALKGSEEYDTKFSSVIKVVGWFDNEEIGSQLRQGAKSNFLPQTIERAVASLSKYSLSSKDQTSSDLLGRTYANSYLLSSDVTHAVNPNFLSAYLENHAPHLNVGLCVAADSNGHMTTDAVSTAILQRCCERIGAKLQVFQIRNDSRSGGTVGPMLSSMTGIRAIDAGMAQLSMHSIRATTGSLDPGLGVLTFTGFLNGFEHVDKEFRPGF